MRRHQPSGQNRAARPSDDGLSTGAGIGLGDAVLVMDVPPDVCPRAGSLDPGLAAAEIRLGPSRPVRAAEIK
ncbi:hypothetical protein GCM10007890_13440 [Methylobacterium tardum]|uniref:Uncharacterized protein n=1 Tax=Methylobacterium tardum TaxID=374432 RepID=A0AA37TH95_9HYPH|nr:hypothetical protein GCM10007890_13440 [Methylobacterium tardum]